MRQNTVLGDSYIGLTTPPADFATTIAPGGTIPLQQTRPALQIEDLMAGMSTFIGGGALHSMQGIVNRTNAGPINGSGNRAALSLAPTSAS
ncbi:hypothetical protein AB0E01_09075 [Nocardia vinacea]|uniref:hypothetical protein n=1 Tax=Nocardia vinacea TaxID=96468 RepID=UPI0033D7BF69